MGHSKRKLIFQPLILGQSVSFREGWSLLLHGVKCWTILRQVQLEYPCTGPLVACGFDRGDRLNEAILGVTYEIRVAKDVWIFVDDVYIPGNLWMSKKIWGFNFNPEKKKKALETPIKTGGQLGSRYVSLLKPPDFELPREVVYFFSMPSNEVTTKWSKLKFICGPRFRWQ